jgi:hypothetical protein
MSPDTREHDMTGHAHDLAFNTNRLFAAADLLLRAIRSPHGFDSMVDMHDGSFQAGESLPRTTFSSDELVEAMAMLIRMGFVPPHDPSPRTGPPRYRLSRESSHAHP